MAVSIAIDPITRIEGHLKAHIDVEDGVIQDARLTGGMFRGYCGEPYPSRFLLEALRKSGARVTVNADAHCTEAVRFRFDETLALLRDIGFTAVTVLEDGMFVEKPL